MEITREQSGHIERHFPIHRGNERIENLCVLTAIIYVAEHGCKWRGLPARFDPWRTIFTRMNRRAKSGVLDRVFEAVQWENLIQVRVAAVSLDSTMVKVHPDGTGALK